MKYLSLSLLLLSTMAFGARFKSGIVQECAKPKILVSLNSLSPSSREYELCKQTGQKKCCVNNPNSNPLECRPPKTLVDLTTTKLTKAGYVLCKQNLIPNTEKCCIDLRSVADVSCPRGTVVTALATLKPRSEQFKKCLNSLIAGTKSCCMPLIKAMPISENPILDSKQLDLKQ
jgi:hypothetical protein